MIFARSHILRVTLAWGSSVIAMGTRGPSCWRRRCNNSPSPSSQKSVTMAPCKPSRTPSTAPLRAAAAAMMGAVKASNAARVTGPLGWASALSTWITFQPCVRPTSSNPANAVLAAPRSEIAASPISQARSEKLASVVGTAQNVLVSCVNSAVSMFNIRMTRLGIRQRGDDRLAHDCPLGLAVGDRCGTGPMRWDNALHRRTPGAD